jgi:hypothetical protein
VKLEIMLHNPGRKGCSSGGRKGSNSGGRQDSSSGVRQSSIIIIVNFLVV